MEACAYESCNSLARGIGRQEPAFLRAGLKNQASVEQILLPLGIGASHHAHDVAAGVQIEGVRLGHQLQVGFAGQHVALATIAGVAAGDEVFPARRSAAGSRHDMVERQLAGGEDLAAVLAGIAVAQQDVAPTGRESGAVCGDIPTGG